MFVVHMIQTELRTSLETLASEWRSSAGGRAYSVCRVLRPHSPLAVTLLQTRSKPTARKFKGLKMTYDGLIFSYVTEVRLCACAALLSLSRCIMVSTR